MDDYCSLRCSLPRIRNTVCFPTQTLLEMVTAAPDVDRNFDRYQKISTDISQWTSSNNDGQCEAYNRPI